MHKIFVSTRTQELQRNGKFLKNRTCLAACPTGCLEINFGRIPIAASHAQWHFLADSPSEAVESLCHWPKTDTFDSFWWIWGSIPVPHFWTPGKPPLF